MTDKLVTSLNSPYIQELLPDEMRPFPTLQEELLAWMQEDYPQNPYFPENRNVSTIASSDRGTTATQTSSFVPLLP